MLDFMKRVQPSIFLARPRSLKNFENTHFLYQDQFDIPVPYAAQGFRFLLYAVRR